MIWDHKLSSKSWHRQKKLIHHHRCRILFLSGLVELQTSESHSVLLVERKEHFPVLQQKSLAEVTRMKWVLPLGNYTDYRDVYLACFVEVPIFLQLPGKRKEREALIYWEEPQILLTDLLNKDSYYTLKNINFSFFIKQLFLSQCSCYNFPIDQITVKFNRFAQRIFPVGLYKNLQKAQKAFAQVEKLGIHYN